MVAALGILVSSIISTLCKPNIWMSISFAEKFEIDVRFLPIIEYEQLMPGWCIHRAAILQLC
jgi:hypothetical protein